MAQSDLFKRYLDAGIAFTQMTRQRAEEIVRDLVKAGEVQSDQAQQAAQELLERSRENTERLVELVRKEIREQVANLGLVTRDDLAGLRQRIDSLTGRGGAGAASTSSARPAAKPVKTATPAPARTATATKAPAAKAAAKKKQTATTKAASTKKTAAKKAVGKKDATAKRGAAAKKTAAKKS